MAGKLNAGPPNTFPAVRKQFAGKVMDQIFREVILPILLFIIALSIVILVILIIEARRLKEIIRKYY